MNQNLIQLIPETSTGVMSRQIAPNNEPGCNLLVEAYDLNVVHFSYLHIGSADQHEFVL